MTLMEIVVAMAIYGVISLLLVEIMSNVNSTMRATTNLNERLSYEAKYADNRQITADAHGTIENMSKDSENRNNHVVIQFNGNAESGYDGEINAEGVLYEVKYNSDKDNDSSEKTNYKFMVFEETPDISAFPSALPYSIPITFDPADMYPYNITNIVVNEEDDVTGDYTLVAQLNEGTKFPLAKYEKDAEGNYKFDEDNNLIFETPATPNALRIRPTQFIGEGADAKAYEWVIRVDRNPVSMDHGYKKINIKIYADLSSQTTEDTIYKMDSEGNILEDEAGNKIGFPANDFPVFDFNLRFCAFTKDKTGNYASWYDDPGLKYQIKSNLEVQTISIDKASHDLYYDGT